MAKFTEGAKKAGAATSRTFRRLFNLPFGSEGNNGKNSSSDNGSNNDNNNNGKSTSDGNNDKEANTESDAPTSSVPVNSTAADADARNLSSASTGSRRQANSPSPAAADSQATATSPSKSPPTDSKAGQPTSDSFDSTPQHDISSASHVVGLSPADARKPQTPTSPAEATVTHTANGSSTGTQPHDLPKQPSPISPDLNDNQPDDTTMAAADLRRDAQLQPQPLQAQKENQQLQQSRNQHAITQPAQAANGLREANYKENQPPVTTDGVTKVLRKLSLDDGSFDLKPPGGAFDPNLDPKTRAEREQHLRFIGEALDMARLALRINETPVGCVLVHRGKIIAKGMNATNVTRNGTRHAEAMALTSLFSYPPLNGSRTTSLRPKQKPILPEDQVSTQSFDFWPPDEGNEDGTKGHLYPYGQKLTMEPRVSPSIIKECILYVTVEPCVMCASTLRQFGIKKVYFGAVNDKFGGTGGVFSIHANSLPVSADGQTKAAHPTPRPIQLPDGSGTLGTSYPPGGGDGGNVEPGFEIEGGWGRDEAVGLLRRFYVQENGRAPVPRKKEGRAARLAALENDGKDPAAEDDETPGEPDGLNDDLTRDDKPSEADFGIPVAVGDDYNSIL